MQVEEAIRERRTLKAFTDEPVRRELVRELLELAVLAPNHHETEPWRFWVVGRETLQRAERGDGRQEAAALAHGDRRRRQARSPTRRRPRRTTPRSRARSRTSCWPRAGAGSRASGARPACSRARVARILGVPKKVRLIGVVHLGLPGEPFPPQPERSARAVHALARLTLTRLSRTSKTMPWASGSSLEPLIVAVWRRM